MPQPRVRPRHNFDAPTPCPTIGAVQTRTSREQRQDGQVVLIDNRRNPVGPIPLSCGTTTKRERRRLVESVDGRAGIRRDSIALPSTIRIEAGGRTKALPMRVLQDQQVDALIRDGSLRYELVDAAGEDDGKEGTR